MTLTDYELERQRRVEENRRRMEQLGLPQMAEDMAQATSGDAAPKRERKKRTEEGPPPEPTRRSSRMEGKERPNYCFDLERTGSGSRAPKDGPLVPEGDKPEVYGVEHVLALGSHEKEWVMFSDGYVEEGGDRLRMYDSQNGASCHQCRQKTLGLRTSCSRCNSGLGRLCGDCLFARYGENIEEAVTQKDWVCPCCRDICNCSNHRNKKGWAPTKALHRSAKARGYLSAAHYLVLTFASGLEAKRAALASGFCPPELAEKLEEEVAELEEEAARNPAPPPVLAAEAAATATAEGQQQQQQGDKPKRKRKSAAAAGKGGAEGKAAAASGDTAGEGKGDKGEKKKRQRSSGGKKAAASKEAAATAEGAQDAARGKKGGKAGKKAAASRAGEQAAAGKQGEAQEVPAGEKKKWQRKRKGQQSDAPAAAAAAGVLETSGASPSGAVASAEGAAAGGDAEVSAPAAKAAAVEAAPKPSIVLKKAPFAFASRKRLPRSGAALLEAVAAAVQA
ncbi:hypothetical protein ABPG75_004321 [Micractinium tetrahymenae]